MSDLLDRWNLLGLGDLYGPEECAPAGMDSTGRGSARAVESLAIATRQQASDRYVRLAADTVIRCWETGHREAARPAFRQMAGIIAARSPDHVARLDRFKVLLP